MLIVAPRQIQRRKSLRSMNARNVVPSQRLLIHECASVCGEQPPYCVERGGSGCRQRGRQGAGCMLIRSSVLSCHTNCNSFLALCGSTRAWRSTCPSPSISDRLSTKMMRARLRETAALATTSSAQRFGAAPLRATAPPQCTAKLWAGLNTPGFAPFVGQRPTACWHPCFAC